MGLIQIVLYLVFVAIVAAIPFDIVCPWLLNKFREIDSQLEKPETLLYMSKAPFFAFIAKVLDFAKGYGLLFVGFYYFDELTVLLAVGIMLVAHNWSPATKFQNRKHFFLILWGLYSLLYVPFFIVFPISFIVFSLVINSFMVGLILNVIFMILCVWFLQLEPIFLLINFIVFVVTFIAFGIQLFQHFEGENNLSILKSFNNRSV
jgi:hypothetical protein